MPNVNDEAPTRAALLSEAIAAELRAEKGAKQLEYKEIAELTDIPERTLTRYFKSQRQIDAVQLVLVADALGTTAGDIVARARMRSGI